MEFSDLKAAIKQKNKVTKLNLSNQELETVPYLVKSFRHLINLDISSNLIYKLPEWTGRLSTLETLDISYTLVKTLPEQLVLCKKLQTINSKCLSTKIKKQIKVFLAIIQEANRLNLDDNDRLLWINLFYNKPKPKIPVRLLLIATNSSFEVIRNNTLSRISARFRKHSGKQKIDSSSKLAYTGILAQRALLKGRLARFEIPFGQMANQKTSHLVVGLNANFQEKELKNNPTIVLLTEQDLQQQLDLLETPYLMTDSLEGSISNLAQLLTGTDDQLDLALEIMSGGGFPQSLKTEIFVISTLHFNSYFKVKAKRLLERYGSPIMLDFIKEDPPFLSELTEAQLEKFLLKCQKKVGLNAQRIVEELYLKYRKGIRFILKHGTEILQTKVLSRQFDGETMRLSKLGLTSLPKRVIKYCLIKTIDISDNPIRELPIDLIHFKALHTIDISKTKIQQLPSWILKIDSLEKIILTNSKVEQTEQIKLLFSDIDLIF